MGELRHLSELMAGAREAESQQATTLLLDGRPKPPETISGLPPARLEDGFTTFDLKRNPGMKAAYDRCWAVSAGQEWCAFLAGPPGTGKTHLAIGAMKAYGLSRSMFWKVPDFLDWLRTKAYSDGGEKLPLDTLLGGYREGEALVVFDDLGVENQTDWVHEQLYRVLDARYDSRLPTIITTNTAEGRIDDRIRSRYAEGLVVCKGKDIRRLS